MNSRYLQIADRIAARLCRDALWSSGRCNWTGDFWDRGSISHASLDSSLYAGTSGIALFLHRMACVTNEPIFRATAEGALRTALDKLPQPDGGLYSGGLGVYYVAAEMQIPLHEDAILLQAEVKPFDSDLLTGSAGAIAALLRLAIGWQSSQQQQLCDAAVRHGDLLIAEAIRQEHGWCWPTAVSSQPLTGFSHGAAGVGWALAELYRASQEKRFREAALNAFRFEQHHWNAKKRNWPDLRGDKQLPGSTIALEYPVYWCHGATGIGFSRIRSWQILGDDKLQSDALNALETVSEKAHHLRDYSLCHGELGNADFLLYAAQALPDSRLLREAEAIADAGIERFDRPLVPWPCGLKGADETPGLMLGLAGIGHFYLRMADPARTPTILLPMP